MASRWRIRHKLLLGVGLVVAIMALLLCGTLYGLWAFYLTTNIIRAKQDELFAALALNATVAELTTPQNIYELVRSPDGVEPAIKKVADALENYKQQLGNTLAEGRDPRHGLAAQGV